MRLVLSALAVTALAGLVGSASGTAHAQPKKKPAPKSVKKCVSFDQKLGADEISVRMSLSSDCDFAVNCTMSWKLVCEGEAPRGEGRAFSMESGTQHSEIASAESCDDGTWQIADVKWHCTPSEI